MDEAYAHTQQQEIDEKRLPRTPCLGAGLSGHPGSPAAQNDGDEKELPDAFLRRCFFHYIQFPDQDVLHQIVDVHYPGIKKRLVSEALTQFYEIRETPGLKKKPSTSEALDWIRLLVSDDVDPADLRESPTKALPKLHGALLKNEQDVHLFERLAFLARGQG